MKILKVPNLNLHGLRAFWITNNELFLNTRIRRKAEQQKGELLLDVVQVIEKEAGWPAAALFFELDGVGKGLKPDYDYLEALAVQL